MGRYKCPGSPVKRARKKTITKSPVIAKILEKILLDKYCLIILLYLKKSFQPEIYLVGK